MNESTQAFTFTDSYGDTFEIIYRDIYHIDVRAKGAKVRTELAQEVRREVINAKRAGRI